MLFSKAMNQVKALQAAVDKRNKAVLLTQEQQSDSNFLFGRNDTN
ncbi:MAG: hypothetical protein P1U74_08375 [Legionellaceae bacterium]|nr:hypothetical protein [Legionellaceae bacterium]